MATKKHQSAPPPDPPLYRVMSTDRQAAWAAEAPLLIPLSELDDNPYQPRLAYDEDRIAAIAASIREHGLLQVPVARRVDGGRYQLAFGHTRLRAYRSLMADDPAAWATMPVIVRDLDDETMALHAWTENNDRKDLSVYEEARAIERYTAAFGWNQTQVAAKLGLDRSTVSNKLRLLKLPEQTLARVQAGDLSERQALALLPLLDLPSPFTTPVGFYLDGPGHVASVDQLLDLAPTIDSGSIRKAVAYTIERATRALKDMPWATEPCDHTAVRATLCRDCSIRIVNGNRCPDPACATTKEQAWALNVATDAAASVGLPAKVLEDRYSGYDALRDLDIARLRAVAHERGCSTLGVVVHTGFPLTHAVADHPACWIACVHGQGGRCVCKSQLDRSNDPTVSRRAQETHHRTLIKTEFIEPAERMLTAALATPSASVWGLLLAAISPSAKPPTDEATIRAAVAAALVRNAVKYEVEYGVPDVASARAKLERLLTQAGIDVPWVQDPVEIIRGHLVQAREFAGMGMAQYFVDQARATYDQAVASLPADDLAALVPLAEEIALAAHLTTEAMTSAPWRVNDEDGDVCTQTSAPNDRAGRDVTHLPGLWDKGDLDGEDITFAQITAWADELDQHWAATPPTLADERIVNLLANLLDDLTDEDVSVEDYETLLIRLETMADRVYAVPSMQHGLS